jgi:hypothetical protein
MIDSCCSCCACETYWLGADYLGWQLDGTYLPPLVTTSPSTTPLADAGRLDQPTTQIVSGNSVVGDGWRNGFRIYGGVFLDDCHRTAIVGDYFSTGDDAYNYTSTQNANTIVTRPFYNTETGEDDAEFVSIPGQLDGQAIVSASDELQGAGLALQHCLWSCGNPCNDCRPSGNLMVIGGYRYYQYNSNLSITENLTALQGNTQGLVPGTEIYVRDSFTTRNEFHGGELGLQGRWKRSWWWFDGMAKMAIGGVKRTVTVDGQTINTVPNVGSASFAGGLLTSEVTNIGSYSDSQAVVIPHFRLGVGAQLTSMLSARCGYNLIIWNDVAQAASHLPPGLAVDPRNLPPVQAGGGPEPVFPGIQGSHLVAQGIDVGLLLSY